MYPIVVSLVGMLECYDTQEKLSVRILSTNAQQMKKD